MHIHQCSTTAMEKLHLFTTPFPPFLSPVRPPLLRIERRTRRFRL